MNITNFDWLDREVALIGSDWLEEQDRHIEALFARNGPVTLLNGLIIPSLTVQIVCWKSARNTRGYSVKTDWFYSRAIHWACYDIPYCIGRQVGVKYPGTFPRVYNNMNRLLGIKNPTEAERRKYIQIMSIAVEWTANCPE